MHFLDKVHCFSRLSFSALHSSFILRAFLRSSCLRCSLSPSIFIRPLLTSPRPLPRPRPRPGGWQASSRDCWMLMCFGIWTYLTGSDALKTKCKPCKQTGDLPDKTVLHKEWIKLWFLTKGVCEEDILHGDVHKAVWVDYLIIPDLVLVCRQI